MKNKHCNALKFLLLSSNPLLLYKEVGVQPLKSLIDSSLKLGLVVRGGVVFLTLDERLVLRDAQQLSYPFIASMQFVLLASSSALYFSPSFTICSISAWESRFYSNLFLNFGRRVDGRNVQDTVMTDFIANFNSLH